MNLWKTFVAGSVLFCSTTAHAGLISGFENGLQGWDQLGDVSVQDAASGLAPTQGAHSVFLSTLGANERPFSGVASPTADKARAFLGITTERGYGDPYMAGFADAMSASYAMYGESAAIKTQFAVNGPGFLSFDWNRLGTDGDNAYFTIWNDELGSRINGWVLNPRTYTGGYFFNDVGLCERAQRPHVDGCAPYDRQTGWNTISVWIDQPGTYYLGFGMNEAAEWTVPTVLALDNIRFEVPEPSSTALLALGFLPLAVGRLARRRARPRRG
jgi:hypothetical protein